MPFDWPERRDTDSLDRARRVHEACERHEASWRAGARPRIEDHLGREPGPDPPELLAELLALEVELRLGQGERPTPEEYHARFPGQDDAVHLAFSPPGPGPGDDAGNAPTVAHPRRPNGAGPPSPSLPGTADDRRSPVEAARLGSDLADFELLDEVARGGMGIVFRARKRSLNCLVALKFIQSGTLASEAEKRRFLLEAEAAAALDHPNIVPVYEIDREHGLFFTMKWIDGGHLGRQVRLLRNDPYAAARLLATVARAVHAAHERGYLHRDLKPANILVDAQGRPYVADFGLARRVGQDSSLTQSGAVLGTPSYMAPEQAAGRGNEVGPAADVYSLGAILYELLTGHPPFRADTVMETLLQVLERDPARPGRLRSGVPEELEAICLKCLEKDPADRYPTAEALAEDLDRVLRGEEVLAMRAGPRLRLRRWTRREPQLVSRLIGLGTVEALTQFNFALSPDRDVRLHLGVSTALAAWALVSIVLQAIARRESRRAAVRPAWTAADMAFLTLILRMLDAAGSSMVIGYAVMVAASGLWFRVGLVWLATLLAEGAYGLLVLDAWLRGVPWRPEDHPNIVMASIAITGFMVARQVKRLLVLSSYYEQRLPS